MLDSYEPKPLDCIHMKHFALGDIHCVERIGASSNTNCWFPEKENSEYCKDP